MSPLRTLLWLDATLAWRHRLVHVTAIVALVFGALIGFALPASVERGGADLLVDASAGGRLAPLLAEVDPERVFASREALRAAVAADGGALGVVFEGSVDAPRATVFIQGDEGPARRALIRTGVDALWRQVGGAGGAGELPPPTVLDPGARKPPFNLMFIPILFAVDLCVLGFMFGAVMLLQDRESGTLRAYRVSPGGALRYLAAKLTVNLGLSLLGLVLLVGVAAPGLLARPALYPLVLLCCAGMTALGISVAVFFRGIADFFFPLIIVGLVAATPLYMAVSPTARLAWTWWVPTYHVLFGAEAILFTGDAAVADAALLYSAAFALASIALSGLLIHRRLLQESA